MAKPSHSPHLILVLTYTHVYDDPRVFPMSESLVNLGYQVQVIGIALRKHLPTRNTVSGIEILITPLLHKSGMGAFIHALWRCLKGDMRDLDPNIEERLTNKFAAILFNLWILRIGLGQKPSAIHSHTHSPLPAAWLLSCWHRVPLVFDSCESVPDYFKQVPNTFANRITARLEQLIMPKTDAVITVGERLAQRLRDRGAREVVIIGNWKRKEDYIIDKHKIDSINSELKIDQNSVVIAYFGVLDPERSIHLLLKAVASSPDVTLLISGHGILTNGVIAAAQNYPNIRWLGWLNMKSIPLYTQLANAVYYCLDPKVSIQSYYSTPNKLFEAFAAGKPVIAQRGVGELSAILETTGAGILLDEVTPESLQSAFQQLQNPIFRGELEQKSYAANEQYSWSIAEKRLKILYGKLTKSDETKLNVTEIL